MLMRALLCTSLMVATAFPAFAADAGPITPRKPLRKTPTERLVIPTDHTGRVVATGRLLVKFHDSVKARTSRSPGKRVASLSREKLDTFDSIVATHGLTVRQAINFPETTLREVETRALAHSRRGQPDLAGMIYVEGPLEKLLMASKELNVLPIVEFVEFEQEMITHGPNPWRGGDEDPTCTEPPAGAGDCFSPTEVPFCTDEDCCTLVGGFYPNCVDPDFGAWDVICADLANLFCEMGDKCKTPLTNGGCLEAHPSAGCNNEACCNTVCDIQAFCCDVEWDETCAVLASENCGSGGPDAPTPDFTMDSADPATRLQKYTTFEPVGAGDAFFDATGFTGDGFDLAALEELSQKLIDNYNIGTEMMARGKSIKVGIIEHTAFVTGPKVAEGGEEWHEDLDSVIPEPGQTIITIAGGVLNPDHGTATLGQTVAADNGFGVTGIAKDAQGYFFPIVSAEEGGRTLSAIFSAITTFGPGDILNYSIGPGGGGTLVSAQGAWTLVRLGTDAGITSLISAGNDCFNLDDNPQFDDEDSGAVIVGACWPGTLDPPPPGLGRFCRLGFSNHCRNCDDASLVHCSGWGIQVTTTSGGDLFSVPNAAGNGVNKARAYTSTFNGTSSAAPIVAGLAACLQGLAKQFYGIPLPPEALRDVLSGNTFPQCDIQVSANIPGSADQAVCGGDFNPDEEPRLIGGFPRAYEAGIGVIAGNFFATSPLTDIKIITGDLIFGNTNSVKALDGNFFNMRTKKISAGQQGNGTPPAITYLLGGQTTDVEVRSYTAVLPDDVTGIGVSVIGTTTASYIVTAVYVYNWVDSRWTLIPIFDIQPGGNIGYQALVNQKPENHISSTGIVMVRVWTCGLGAVPKHQVFHDLIDIQVSDIPGFDPFGDPPL